MSGVASAMHHILYLSAGLRQGDDHVACASLCAISCFPCPFLSSHSLPGISITIVSAVFARLTTATGQQTTLLGL